MQLPNGVMCENAKVKTVANMARVVGQQEASAESTSHRTLYSEGFLVCLDRDITAQIVAGRRTKTKLIKDNCLTWCKHTYGLWTPHEMKCPRFPCAAIVADCPAYTDYATTFPGQHPEANLFQTKTGSNASPSAAGSSSSNMEM